MKAIHDVYSRDKTFLDFLAQDLDDNAAWFNSSEFARFHDINGTRILSVLTSDTQSRKIDIRVGYDENPEGISKSRGILFCRAQEIGMPESGALMKVDGKRYTVSEARLIQDQVWRIVLEGNNG